MEASGPLEDDDRTVAALAARLGPAQTFTGTPGADVIVGTDDDDEIDALGGDDDVSGGAGADRIDGRDGADILRGGPDDDEISGGPGDDTINGGGGADTISGGAGDDTVRGKSGNDDIAGGDDNDQLRGGGGDDTINGEAGDDELFGGGGNDQMRGNRGADTLEGGNGDDELDGDAGNDTLNGQKGDDLLQGGDDDDTLIGGQGRDELRGGPGADLLDGKSMSDILVGGAGPDVFAFTTRGGSGDRVLDFVDGEDRLDLSRVLRNYEPGDDPDLYVQLEVIPEGTVVSIDPRGNGTNFEPLAVLEGVAIDAFTPNELGLGSGLPDEVTVVSTNARGVEANATAFAPSLSADGRFVSFSSLADNLVDDDGNGFFDVFVKDLSTGEVERVSQVQQNGGVREGNSDSFFSSISADGEVVAFDSEAGNLAPGDTGQRDVFVDDVGDGDPDLVSIVNNRFATDPSISADGTLVAFSATATGNAETGDPAPANTIMERVYVRDLDNGSLIEASSDANGNFATGGPSSNPDISADGGFVAFDSAASNLLGVDSNPGFDVYVKSLADGSVQNASTTAGGAQRNGNSLHPSISGDGRLVAFESLAQLVAEDTDSGSDIYLKNLQSGAITLVTDGANGASHTPSISDDGRFIAFRSEADNLVAGDGNGLADIFIHDTLSGDFGRIALTSDTSDAVPGLVAPEISGDGTLVAFVDQVVVDSSDGSLDAGQVLVAPTGGAGGAALALSDVLSSEAGPASGGAAAGGSAPAGPPALSALMVEPDAV